MRLSDVFVTITDCSGKRTKRDMRCAASSPLRLKLPGTWWLAANAEHMLALRVSRANSEWASYWATSYLYAA